MKKLTINLGRLLAIIMVISIFSACKKYLNIIPKGSKIPTSFADYEAIVRDEYTNHTANVSQAVLLLNDRFESSSNLSFSQLSMVNYNWDENTSRIPLNSTSEQTYTTMYAAISSSNLLIRHVPESTEGTDAQKSELVAQARIMRAFSYNQLVNYYADAYQASDAALKKSVPLITSADLGAAHMQVSIEEMYAFMLKDIEEAIPFLNERGATGVHPTVGAAYALRARILLAMGQYQSALDAANEALKRNSTLFDWVEFYNRYRANIERPNQYTLNPSPMNYNFVENFYFRHGASAYPSREPGVRQDRALRFETGDAKFASRWKLRTVGGETYYYSILTGVYNHAGLTTTEMFLIRAECQARLNNVAAALSTLDLVRVKRIFPANYQASVADNVVQAVKLIQKTKGNEMLFSLVPFSDRRRLNKDLNYAVTLTKTENNLAVSLSPSSHLYTMPIPLGAISNPGSGIIQQNVDK